MKNLFIPKENLKAQPGRGANCAPKEQKMPARKQGLRARAQRHAAVGDERPARLSTIPNSGTCWIPTRPVNHPTSRRRPLRKTTRNGFDVPIIVRRAAQSII